MSIYLVVLLKLFIMFSQPVREDSCSSAAVENQGWTASEMHEDSRSSEL